MEDLSFEEMLEQSLANDNFEIGDEIKGTYISHDDENVFIDISGKSEAILDILEVTDETGQVKIDDNFSADFIISEISAGEIKVTLHPGKGFTSVELLSQCFHKQIPVEGKVIAINKNGAEIHLGGKKAFCPMSQLDNSKNQDLERLIGKTLKFKIIELSGNGRNIVVSRRELLDEVKEVELIELRRTLSNGDVLEGEITRVESFGIFVKYRSLEGLIHVSQLSLSKLIRPESFNIGDKVKFKVLELDWENNKHSFSIKALEDNPWQNVSDDLIGTESDGIVSKFVKGGALIELKPGFEGYLPVSRMSYTKRINTPEDILELNQKVKVKIVELTPSSQKMLLELISGEENPWEKQESEESIHQASIEKNIGKGLIVRIPNGMEGFIPASELKMSPSDNNYSIGNKIKCAIIEINRSNKKLILSEKNAEHIEERIETEKYMSTNSSSESGGNTLGSMFGDILNNINTDKN